MRQGRSRALLRALASPGVTLGLMLALALVAAFGTLLPPPADPAVWQERFGTEAPWWQSLDMGGYFSSWWFRGLWGVLLLNLLACGVRRSGHGLRDLTGRGTPRLRLPGTLRGEVVSLLEKDGFRIRRHTPLHASRRRYGFLGFPLAHLCPFAIVLGALWGSWAGFTGTTYGLLNQPTWTFFNWSDGRDQDLPFVLVVEEIRKQYYPLKLRIGIGEREEEGRLVETRVGDRVSAAPHPYEVEVIGLDVTTKDLQFVLHGEAGRLGPFSSVEGEAPLRVVPVAYKDPDVKQVEADLTLRGADGAVLARHTLAVNRPVVADSLRLYLTAWSPDLEEDPWIGLQIVKDPGQWLVWTGSVGLLGGALLLAFVRSGWAREEGGEILIKADRRLLRRLQPLGSGE